MMARRPRGVQEKPKRLGDAKIAQFRAERQEMIVLHPIGGVLLFEPKKRPGHKGVHFAIGEIIPVRGADQIGARMQRGP